jgi:hypothetical protein
MLNQRVIVLIMAALFSAALLVFSAGAQSPPACPSGEPPCRNQTPMAGHGAAKDMPASLGCNCPSDTRRVITLRIDSTWNVSDSSGTHPNTNIQDALNCAINQWNTAKDSSGHTTDYRLVYDGSGVLGATADITITNQTPSTGGFAETTRTFPFTMRLAPTNGNLGGGTFTADDLCGRIAHEIGHKLGLAEVSSTCNSIMDGANPNGTRDVKQVQPNDVQQVRNSFNPTTRTNGTCTAPGVDHEPADDEGVGDGCGGDPCCGDACCGDPCCYDPTSCGGWSYCVTYYETDCYDECWVINAYTMECEYWHTSCSTSSWVECY